MAWGRQGGGGVVLLSEESWITVYQNDRIVQGGRPFICEFASVKRCTAHL